jgi:hypothetical protein
MDSSFEASFVWMKIGGEKECSPGSLCPPEELGGVLLMTVVTGVAGLGSVAGGGDGPVTNGEAISVAGVIERYVEACGGAALANLALKGLIPTRIVKSLIATISTGSLLKQL